MLYDKMNTKKSLIIGAIVGSIMLVIMSVIFSIVFENAGVAIFTGIIFGVFYGAFTGIMPYVIYKILLKTLTRQMSDLRREVAKKRKILGEGMAKSRGNIGWLIVTEHTLEFYGYATDKEPFRKLILKEDVSSCQRSEKGLNIESGAENTEFILYDSTFVLYILNELTNKSKTVTAENN